MNNLIKDTKIVITNFGQDPITIVLDQSQKKRIFRVSVIAIIVYISAMDRIRYYGIFQYVNFYNFNSSNYRKTLRVSPVSSNNSASIILSDCVNLFHSSCNLEKSYLIYTRKFRFFKNYLFEYNKTLYVVSSINYGLIVKFRKLLSHFFPLEFVNNAIMRIFP